MIIFFADNKFYIFRHVYSCMYDLYKRCIDIQRKVGSWLTVKRLNICYLKLGELSSSINIWRLQRSIKMRFVLCCALYQITMFGTIVE